MGWCAEASCKRSKLTHPELTFFCLPRDKDQAKAWRVKTNREDKLPKKIFFCEKHFKKDWMHLSTEEMSCFPGNTNKQGSCYLVLFQLYLILMMMMSRS